MKNINFIFVLTCFLCAVAYSQTAIHFPQQEFNRESTISSLVRTNSGELILFWVNDYTKRIYMSRSSNEGLTWTPKLSLPDYLTLENISDFNTFIDNSSKIFIQIKAGGPNVMNYFTYSNDNGNTWLAPQILRFNSANFFNNYRGYYTSLGKLSNNNLVFIHSYAITSQSIPQGIYFSRYLNNTWTNHQLIDPTGVWGFMFSPSSNIDMVVFADSNGNKTDLFFRKSTDAGLTWSTKQLLLTTQYSKSRPRVTKSGNEIYLFYEENIPTYFNNIYQKEIFYIKSNDNAQSWSLPVRVTKYAGNDNFLSIAESTPQPLITFVSDRNCEINRNNRQVYLLKGLEMQSPPVLLNQNSYKDTVPIYSQINLRALVDTDGSIESVKLILIRIGAIDTIQMYDDGLHQDSLAGDRIYGATFNISDETIYLYVKIQNSFGLSNTQYLGIVTTPISNQTSNYLLSLNRISVPINDFGVIADVNVSGTSNGRFDGKPFLYGSGFTMVGKNQNQWWANAVFSPARVRDYIRGVAGIQNDPRYRLYAVSTNDAPFGDSWQDWRNAVAIGADFYDGNGDSIYNPVDLNGNGQWDIGEDKPDLIGDFTAWCIFNDGIPANLRLYQSEPMGINIKQTIFGVKPNSPHQANNMFFVRYRISQNGSVAQTLDSVYFMIRTDPDIGMLNEAFWDDLLGCDTLLNSGYAYNDGDDFEWGFNPPAVAFTLLQGPAVYIPGVTFIDNNSNGIYDPGIDTALDSAYVRKGPLLGVNVFPGAKNQIFNSFSQYLPANQMVREPQTVIEVRNRAWGYNSMGGLFNPCTFDQGQVRGNVPCNLVNPLFMYSGNPVNNIGWINIVPNDQRATVSTGPFKLIANKEIDIWVGYIVGRGNSALNSVSVMKDNIQYAIDTYRNNFSDLPVSVKEDKEIIVEHFELYQNYPNPFNPNTIISWQLPVSGWVTLKVFDVLGSEVATLVNEFKNAGKYELEFNSLVNGKQLTSGVYFYQLKSGSFLQTKKMMLTK